MHDLLEFEGKVTAVVDTARYVEIRARPGLHQEQFEVVALDDGPPVSLSLRWLEDRKPEEEAAEAAPRPETRAEAAETAAAAAESIGEVPIAEVAEPAEVAPPDAAGAEAVSPLGEKVGDTAAPTEFSGADPGEDSAELGRRLLASAAPITEMLDAEAESPILPASDEREES